jgi:hypothetical protein
MTISKPTAPVINLNGSPAARLIEEYKTAYVAIRAAFEALCQVTVNGRDFQTAPEGTYEKARTEHVARLDKLQQVEGDLVALAIAVQEQMDAQVAGQTHQNYSPGG